MKSSKFNLLLGVFSVIALIGCSPEVSPDWGDIWNTTEVCFTIKDANTNQPIAGAVIELIRYGSPDCITCPIDLDETSNGNGKACMNLTVGWWCDSAEITADAYIPKTFSGKPPTTIYLTRNPTN